MTDWKKYTTLTLHNKTLEKEELITLSNHVLNSKKEGWEKAIFNFILEWLNNDDFITVFTSGSTGKPKEIKLQKSALIFSAKNTINFLKLNQNDTALLCIPAKYIGGKMMIIRSFVGGLNLSFTKPTSTPFKEIKNRFKFSAITPQQAICSSNKNLEKIEQIIIGGGNVNNLLSSKLNIINSTFYSTYGMTETCSHIALKNISKGEEYFTTLNDINLKLDKRNCLIIDAPKLSEKPILTNDIVELISEKKFIWKGRFDNIINSGGIKLHPEEIEAKISPFIPVRFFLSKEEDYTLGERLILVVESEQKIDLNFPENLLGKYEKPKKIYYIKKFIETESGKIHRTKTLNQ